MYPNHCQSHREIWIMISSGVGCITCEGIVKDYKLGDSVIIPKGIKHSIQNLSNESLLYIEIQHGTYLGKEDNFLIEDDCKCP